MLALQALCVHEAVGEHFAEELSTFLHDHKTHLDLGLPRAPRPEVLSFARRLVEGTWRNRARYDQILTETASDWSIARMPPVDRNILRLGLHELLEEPDTPPEVVINEAIELARLFAAEDSPGFVNGVLDAARRRFGVPASADATPPPTAKTEETGASSV